MSVQINNDQQGLNGEDPVDPSGADGEILDDDTSASLDAEATDPDRGDGTGAGSGGRWRKTTAYGVIPAFALIAAVGAGVFTWIDVEASRARTAAEESVQAARDSTVAMLSYQPGNVRPTLEAARGLLTGEFQSSYTQLINDVVIPGAEEKQISAVAEIPAAASISADTSHAKVLVFVNQTVVIDDGAPVNTASAVRVGLDKVHERWLISSFEPV
jgi:Mce-associated membrane protein